MPITFYCPECTQKLRIDDDFAGKLVACTRCGARLRVPGISQTERAQPAAAKPQSFSGRGARSSSTQAR